jgi:hypothetical protein
LIYYNDYQAETSKSTLIGYCEIKYYKNSYIQLAEYLFHSVYDTKSLAQSPRDCFSPYEYLHNTTHTNLSEIDPNSPFKQLYANQVQSDLSKIQNTLTLDSNLVKSRQFIELPKDWNLLAQSVYPGM